jgi:MSHA biogenesis protein MshI
MTLSIQSLWSRNPGGWSAIDMHGGVFGVSVQLPRQAGQKPKVLQHVAYPAQSADAAVLAQMGRVLLTAQFDVVTLLDRHDYQIFMVDKPVVRPDEVEGSLRLAISPMLDYPSTEANLAWLDIPIRQTMGNRVAQLYAVIAKTEHVNARASLFEEAKMRLNAVDIREVAQRNISLLLETENAATCLIYAEPEGVQLTITYRGELYLVRFISEALFGDTDAQGRDKLAEAIDRLALEIQRSFDFIRRNYPALTIDTLFVAPTLTEIGLAEALKQHLIEQVMPLNLSRIFDLPPGSDLNQPEVQAQYFHVLGSALRIQTKE